MKIVKQTEKELVLKHELHFPFMALFCFVMPWIIPLYIGLIFFSLSEPIIFNNSERQLTYKSLFGTKTKHYSFAQIKELILDSDTDSDGDKWYRLKVVFPAENLNHNQFEITLISDLNIEKVRKLANIVADFIDIPYQDLSDK